MRKHSITRTNQSMNVFIINNLNWTKKIILLQNYRILCLRQLCSSSRLLTPFHISPSANSYVSVNRSTKALYCICCDYRLLTPALDWDVITGGNNDGRNYLQLSLLHSLQFSVLQTRTAAYCHGACTSKAAQQALTAKSCTPLAETRSGPQRERHKKAEEKLEICREKKGWKEERRR